ncbi:MAG: CoA transferase [Pseudomonadota bacterium]
MGTEAPLAGVRVLDLTNVLAGPFACYQLALMGAEVIKVERPGSGDLARQLGADPARSAAHMGISFLAQNAGKKSVTLNLKAPEGRDLLHRLLEGADVLVENYRPGVMDRLGVGYAALRAVRPELIYCAISGFGQDGPWRDNPAYDQIVQGVSGVMSITGDVQSAPLRVGYPLADTVGGMTAAFAIASALNARPRGGFLDVSMTEAVLATMGWVVSNHLIAGVEPQPQGNENVTSAPSGTFATADAPINIAANKQEQWEALALHLGLAELIARPDYASRDLRKAHRDALRRDLEAVLRTRPAAAWVPELNGLGIPAGPVLSVGEVLASDQIAGRGLVGRQRLGSGEEIALTASPVVLDGVRPAAETPPPELGADNAAVYGALGLSGAEVAGLAARGVI